MLQNLGNYTTPIMAVIVAYIGYRQWRTANDKLRLDLYNRRLEVYFAALALGDVVAGWKGTEEEKAIWVKFKRAVSEAQLLFPPESCVGEQFQALKNNSQNIVLLDVLMMAEEKGWEKGPTEWQQFRVDAINLCVYRRFLIDDAIWPYLEFYSSSGGVGWIAGLQKRRQFRRGLKSNAESSARGIEKIMAEARLRTGRPPE